MQNLREYFTKDDRIITDSTARPHFLILLLLYPLSVLSPLAQGFPPTATGADPARELEVRPEFNKSSNRYPTVSFIKS